MDVSGHDGLRLLVGLEESVAPSRQITEHRITAAFAAEPLQIGLDVQELEGELDPSKGPRKPFTGRMNVMEAAANADDHLASFAQTLMAQTTVTKIKRAPTPLAKAASIRCSST